MPRLQQDGQAWPEGEAGLRSLLGRIRGHRRWCEAPATAEVAAAAEAVNQVPGSEAASAAAVPLAGPQSPCTPLGPATVLAEEPAVKKPRLADGVARLWAAAAVVPGPLAAAAGPEERRRLKRAADRPAGGAVEPRAENQASAAARAKCSSVSVAAMVAAWGRCEGIGLAAGRLAGRQAAAPSLRAAGIVQLVPLQPVQHVPVPVQPVPVPLQPVQPVQPVPLTSAKRARLASVVQAGPSVLSWQPYAGHMALRLGRGGLWCLYCFTQPVGDYRVWLRGRCSHVSPPSAAPSSFSAALLRSRDLDANASEALRRRFTLLRATARVVPVPGAAFPAGRQAGGRQVQEQ